MNAAIIRRHHSGLPAHPNELDRWRPAREYHDQVARSSIGSIRRGQAMVSQNCSLRTESPGNVNVAY